MKKLKNIINLVVFTTTVISFTACNNNKTLPILGPREAVTKKVEGREVVDTLYKTIPNWSFYNQDSVLINQETFKDKIYVTDFFFTSCSTICPTMHRNLKMVYELYKDDAEVGFLSHTIDFKYDLPSKLKTYAGKLGVDTKKWEFVWGTKAAVYTLAEKDYLVAVQEDSTATDGYIHQGWLILVDKQRRLRGAYDGTKQEEIEKLKNDMVTLLAEYKK